MNRQINDQILHRSHEGADMRGEPMSNLIDRQAAIDAMCWACGNDCDKSKFVYNAPQDKQVIMCPEHYALFTLPSADPERKKGKWVKTGQSFVFSEKFRNYSCSECGYDIDKTKFNFCPNCGSFNGGEEDDI